MELAKNLGTKGIFIANDEALGAEEVQEDLSNTIDFLNYRLGTDLSF